MNYLKKSLTSGFPDPSYTFSAINFCLFFDNTNCEWIHPIILNFLIIIQRSIRQKYEIRIGSSTGIIFACTVHAYITPCVFTFHPRRAFQIRNCQTSWKHVHRISVSSGAKSNTSQPRTISFIKYTQTKRCARALCAMDICVSSVHTLHSPINK